MRIKCSAVPVLLILMLMAGLCGVASAGDSLTLGDPVVLGEPQPDLDLTFEGYTGYVVSPIPVFILNPYERAWRVRITGGDLKLQSDPSVTIPSGRIEYRDAKSPTAWGPYGGLITNLAGNPHMKVEMRIQLTGAETPGYYVSDAVLDWMIAGENPGDPMLTGALLLRLHLNIPDVLSFTVDDPYLIFTDTAGNVEGWIYSTEGQVTVYSNEDFSLSLSVAGDLIGGAPGDHILPTALQLRQPWGDGALWSTWGDAGDTPHGQITDPWGYPADGGSPWPGPMLDPAVITTQGTNPIGIQAATFRRGVLDPTGDYSATVTLTFSVMP